MIVYCAGVQVEGSPSEALRYSSRAGHPVRQSEADHEDPHRLLPEHDGSYSPRPATVSPHHDAAARRSRSLLADQRPRHQTRV